MAFAASPLRYPGGKACLYGLVATVLRLNGLERGHYAEPFAGGFGLGLTLLYGGHVADVHINDIDQAIWSFWYSILNRSARFLDRVVNTPVTVDEWRRQREIFRRQNILDPLKLGFSAFYLNRTNRSGVIAGGGVIGGLNQLGSYKIDCRYNIDELTRRIRRISKYKDRIHLTRMDGLEFIKYCYNSLPANLFSFIDPPYYGKGSELYTSFYTSSDHTVLAKNMMEIDRHWIITYDDVAEIHALYKERRRYSIGVRYSVNTKRIGDELLIASKNLRIPGSLKQKQASYVAASMADG